LRLAHEACRRAALECRRYGLDDLLLGCAAVCDRAMSELELVSTVAVHD
jgi:hypothetical protein